MDDMEDLVMAFNGLPRPQSTPDGQPNHWVFGIWHMPLQPHRPLQPSDQLLMAVHPPSTITLQSRPVQLVTGGPLLDTVTAIVSMLLDVFIRGRQDPSTGEQQCPSFAPRTWAFSGDEEIYEAMRQKLEECGVHDDLCRVRWCTQEEKDILDRQWSRLFAGSLVQPTWDSLLPSGPPNAVQLDDDSQCHHCRMSLSTWTERCNACHKAYYCSKLCQWADKKRHEPHCPANHSDNC